VTKAPDQTPEDAIYFCDRCGALLRPGTGDHFRVSIEAVADPSPPVVCAQEEPRDLRRRIERLLAEMKDLSPQEAMDQVYRRVTLYLCLKCYRPWIENPAGGDPPNSF
jgi:DNA-directed RNA polymerase subunit RPC12/RpoP